MRVLIDANVLLDYILIREPFSEDAHLIVDMCRNEQLDGCIAAHSVSNIFYILRGTYNSDERREILLNICEIFDVIGIDEEKVISALHDKAFTDFEDCLQARCASEFDADYIISRNINDFSAATIPCLLPTDFIKRLEQNAAH